MDDEYEQILSEGAEQQELAEVAGDICKISGVQYLCLPVDILAAGDAIGIGESEFYKKYKMEDEFVVKLNDTNDGRDSPTYQAHIQLPSICIDKDIERYMWTTEHVAFPTQWKMLAGMREIKENQKTESIGTNWTEQKHMQHEYRLLVRR